MLGYIAKVRNTGRHDTDTFPYAIMVDNGVHVNSATEKTETRHRALFVDCPFAPTVFAYSTLYDPEEVENWVARVSLNRLAELTMRADRRED